MDIWSFVGYAVMLLIALVVIIALVGYGILCFIGATIGGVLTLNDKIQNDTNS